MFAKSDRDELHAIIADPARDKAIELRMRLTHLPEYQELKVTDRLVELLELVQQGESAIDIVFISSEFPEDRIQESIEEIQRIPQAECCVFVMLLRPETQKIQTVADALVLGAHGCLSEPFSIENVQEVTSHALRLRTKLREARDSIAIKCIIKDAMKAIDAVSQHLKLEKPPGDHLRRLREVGESIKRVAQKSEEQYHSMLISMLESAPLPDFLPGLENYTGTSRAVLRRRNAKLARMKEGQTGPGVKGTS